MHSNKETEEKPQSLQQLNAVLQHKLSGINQYFLHARMLKHQGLMEIADYTYRSSIDAMKSSDMLVEQILSMGGVPDMQHMDPVNIGETPKQMLSSDLAHAQRALGTIEQATQSCADTGLEHAAQFLQRMAETQKERIDTLQSLLDSLPTT
jgi:bacterioferritin